MNGSQVTLAQAPSPSFYLFIYLFLCCPDFFLATCEFSTYYGKHFVMHVKIESLCCTPETEAGSRWAPQGEALGDFIPCIDPSDRYSETRIPRQSEEEAGPCLDRR